MLAVKSKEFLLSRERQESDGGNRIFGHVLQLILGGLVPHIRKGVPVRLAAVCSDDKGIEEALGLSLKIVRDLCGPAFLKVSLNHV